MFGEWGGQTGKQAFQDESQFFNIVIPVGVMIDSGWN